MLLHYIITSNISYSVNITELRKILDKYKN